MKIYIASEQDRLIVASVLIKSGYTVSQKRERKQNAKTGYDWYLYATKEDDPHEK